MSNKWSVKPDQAEFLVELEKITGNSIELESFKTKWNSTALVKISENEVIELSFISELFTEFQILLGAL